MPRGPLRACPVPYCNGLAGRCARHRREADQRRPSAPARGYDAAWTRLARRWLARYPWCGQRRDGRLYAVHSACVRRGTRVRASCVDHIQSLADGGARLDLGNLQSLCTSCNTAKG